MSLDLLKIPYFVLRRFSESSKSCSFCKENGKPTSLHRCLQIQPVISGRNSVRYRFCQDCVLLLKLLQTPTTAAFERIEPFLPNIVRTWLMANKILHFDNVKEKVGFHSDVFVPLWESRWCFLFGLYSATIALISAAVEVAINTDTRMSEIRGRSKYGWVSLSNDTLEKARKKGLPVGLLLRGGEIQGNRILKEPKLIFVERRNKIDHGDIKDLPFSNSYITSQQSEKEAYDQLYTGQSFLLSWAGSDGNPVNNRISSEGMKVGDAIPAVYDASLLTKPPYPYDSNRWR